MNESINHWQFRIVEGIPDDELCLCVEDVFELRRDLAFLPKAHALRSVAQKFADIARFETEAMIISSQQAVLYEAARRYYNNYQRSIL